MQSNGDFRVTAIVSRVLFYRSMPDDLITLPVCTRVSREGDAVSMTNL